MSEPDEHSKAAVSTKQRRGLYDINEGFRGDEGKRPKKHCIFACFGISREVISVCPQEERMN